MSFIEAVVAWNGYGRSKPRLAAFEYDFAVDGGAVGAITLRGTALPAGAVVTDSLVKCVTAATSGGSATVSLGIEGAADIQAATAFSSAPYAAAGAKHGAALTATTAPVVTTAARSVVATVAVAALTAGKLVVVLTYVNVAA